LSTPDYAFAVSKLIFKSVFLIESSCDLILEDVELTSSYAVILHLPELLNSLNIPSSYALINALVAETSSERVKRFPPSICHHSLLSKIGSNLYTKAVTCVKPGKSGL